MRFVRPLSPLFFIELHLLVAVFIIFLCKINNQKTFLLDFQSFFHTKVDCKSRSKRPFPKPTYVKSPHHQITCQTDNLHSANKQKYKYSSQKGDTSVLVAHPKSRVKRQTNPYKKGNSLSQFISSQFEGGYQAKKQKVLHL